MFKYKNRDYVAVESAPSPLVGKLNDASNRHGPYYLQVFDKDAKQVGPTFRLTGIPNRAASPFLSVLDSDPVIIATDESETGRWWIVDFKAYLDDEAGR